MPTDGNGTVDEETDDSYHGFNDGNPSDDEVDDEGSPDRYKQTRKRKALNMKIKTKRQKVKGGKTTKTSRKQTLKVNPPKISERHTDGGTS